MNVVRTQMGHVNVNIMTNEQKAMVYDDCIRESERLQRINSKFKSDYPDFFIEVIGNNWVDERIGFKVSVEETYEQR